MIWRPVAYAAAIATGNVYCMLQPCNYAGRSFRVRSVSLLSNADRSFVQQTHLFGRNVQIFRDDTHCLPGIADVCGNKARKLWQLFDCGESRDLISYGGAQSNAMFALAAFSRARKSNFIYFTRGIPTHLLQNPVGNFKHALELGMHHFPLDSTSYKQLTDVKNLDISSFFCQLGLQLPTPLNAPLFVPQGVACALAKPGVEQLCNEVSQHIIEFNRLHGERRWKVCMATGTGVSALFAARYFAAHPSLRSTVTVVALSCVLSTDGLLRDMRALDADTGGVGVFPDVMGSSVASFGTPSRTHMELWRYLNSATQSTFDLLYAPRAWELLLTASTHTPSAIASASDLQLTPDAWSTGLATLFPGERLLYYHCGGAEGNESQLLRYRRLGLLS